jgi:hypothetical protein
MRKTEQARFRSEEERRRQQPLEAQYRDLGSRDVRAAMQIRPTQQKPVAKRGNRND